MITQKFDHRKIRKRETFFMLRFMPFLFLAFIVFFMINNVNENNQEAIGKLTGKVTNTLSLSKINYSSSEELQGNLNISFVAGDFLPLNSNVSFAISSKYPWYYTCENGQSYEWRDINGKLVVVDGVQVTQPWSVFCDDSLAYYNCTEYGKKCCPYGVAGKIYYNLANCSGLGLGYCGDNCSSAPKIFNLSHLILKSITPTKGNFSQNGKYTNNGVPLNEEGVGVGYCNAIVEPPVQHVSEIRGVCNDTDSTNNVLYKGNCKDWTGKDVNDSCDNLAGGVSGFESSGVVEWACKRPVVNNTYSWNCRACTEAECLYPDSFLSGDPLPSGFYTYCTSESKETVRFLIKEDPSCDSRIKELYPVCDLTTNTWIDPYSCLNSTASCSDNYVCNDGKCSQQISNCSDWDNIYKIPLSNLDLDVPNKQGNYSLDVVLSWKNTILSSYNNVLSFVVYERHKECRNDRCVLVAGFGEDECNANYDCSNCTSDWSYSEWGSCVNGFMYRNATDTNGCRAKKIESQSCQTCVSSWTCLWQSCSGSIQKRLCSDAQQCNPNNISYFSEPRSCCTEDWSCSDWSKCQNGLQTRTCQDSKQCDTEFTKPNLQKQCNENNIPWLWIIIIAGILVIGLIIIVILLITKKKTTMSPGIIYRPYQQTPPINTLSMSQVPEKNKITRKANPVLVDYIKKAFSAGLSRADIEKNLLNKGWPKEEVVLAINSLA